MAARAGQHRADSAVACPGAVRRHRPSGVAQGFRAAARPRTQPRRWPAVTNPSVDTAQSGDAVDAVRTLQAELSSDYSEMRSAEIQLTEAILTVHAVTVSGRSGLQDIQHQLIEAINNPVTALNTPAGERHFLLFLRSKIAEIQDIVDTGALTNEDHAKLTRALGSGYLLSTSDSEDAPSAPSGGVPMADQAAGVMPASARHSGHYRRRLRARLQLRRRVRAGWPEPQARWQGWRPDCSTTPANRRARRPRRSRADTRRRGHGRRREPRTRDRRRQHRRPPVGAAAAQRPRTAREWSRADPARRQPLGGAHGKHPDYPRTARSGRGAA